MRDGQISAQDVGVAYRLYREKVSTLKEAVANRFRHTVSRNGVPVLDHQWHDVKIDEAVRWIENLHVAIDRAFSL